MLIYKNINNYVYSSYVVKMVATSTESFHSLLFSDCNIAIGDTRIKQEVNLWEKGPIFLGGELPLFFLPQRVEERR